MDYLTEIWGLARAVNIEADYMASGTTTTFEGHPDALRKWLVKIRVRLEAWMSENEWWRDAAKLDPAYHEDNAAEAGVPVIFKTFLFKGFATAEERNEFEEEEIENGSGSGHVNLQFFNPSPDNVLFGIFDENFSIVTSVNGTPHTSFEQVKNLLLEEDSSDKRLQVVHSVFAEIFFNPALIIDLGLLDLLKFQIEELKIDPNYQECSGILLRHAEYNAGYQEEPLEEWSLLFHALAQPDQRLFDYLLSLQGIEANPVLEIDRDGYDIRGSGYTLLHDIPRFASHPLLDEEIDLISRIRRILESAEVVVDCRDNHGRTPLEYLCEHMYWVDRVRRPRLQYDLARLYLSFGAGATEHAKNSLQRFPREETEDHNDAEHNKYCRELIALLADTQRKRVAQASTALLLLRS